MTIDKTTVGFVFLLVCALGWIIGSWIGYKLKYG